MNEPGLIIKAPGKLMIAGEYAVLTCGCPAIVAAIDRYMTVKISHSSRFIISEPDSPEITWAPGPGGAVFGLDAGKFSVMKASAAIAIKYLTEKGVHISPFRLEIQNGLNDAISGRKYGLGSSAALTVGLISAILAFHGMDIEKERSLLYKLSCIAHLKTQGNGSCADIAACVYGGWLCYYRYEAGWLTDKLKDDGFILHDLVGTPWPGLSVSRISLPDSVRFIAGWTKHPVKTPPLVSRIEAFKAEHEKEYEVFLEQSRAAVMEFIQVCNLEDGERVLQAVRRNRAALRYLEEITGLKLETDEIFRLCQVAERFGSGKFSGAGGGDCGIAFLTDERKIEDLKREWMKAGIVPLDIQCSIQGVTRLK